MSSEPTPGEPLSWKLGAAGNCPTVEYGGRTWKFGHPVQKAREFLEGWIAAQAVREVNALRGLLDPAEYEQARKDVLGMVAGKWYRTGGQGWLKALEGADGHLLFVFALLRVHQPDCTPDDAKRVLNGAPDETVLALEQVAPDFFLEAARFLPTASPDPAELETQARTLYEGFMAVWSAALRTPAATR